MKVAASSTRITASKLPPTERTAWYHSLRVYIQVEQWKTLMNCELNPINWGWILEKGKLQPIITDQEIAPEELLSVIRCNCKLSSRNPCGSNQCSCKRNGIYCVTACGDCQGINCENNEKKIDFDDDETDEVDDYRLTDDIYDY